MNLHQVKYITLAQDSRAIQSDELSLLEEVFSELHPQCRMDWVINGRHIVTRRLRKYCA